MLYQFLDSRQNRFIWSDADYIAVFGLFKQQSISYLHITHSFKDEENKFTESISEGTHDNRVQVALRLFLFRNRASPNALSFGWSLRSSRRSSETASDGTFLNASSLKSTAVSTRSGKILPPPLNVEVTLHDEKPKKAVPADKVDRLLSLERPVRGGRPPVNKIPILGEEDPERPVHGEQVPHTVQEVPVVSQGLSCRSGEKEIHSYTR